MSALLRHLSLTLLVFALGLAPALVSAQPGATLPNFRPYDQNGVSMFEPPKENVDTNTRFRFGVGFTQQFQMLDHSNTADVILNTDSVNVNALKDIGAGFNLATANLNLDATLVDGVRVNLVTYLSSRHHPETWVKSGFVQIDALPMLHSETVDNIMESVTLRVGHMEVNYGDTHFRRTDNGNAMYNPFVGNYLMDSFATEIGAELYVQKSGFLGMFGITDGEIQGRVDRPDDRSPSIYGKLGFDRQINEDLRVRLTGSAYATSSSASNTLFSGDRAGSRYYYALENTSASTSGNFRSGRINPGFSDAVTTFQINPFVQFNGVELFGVFEQAKGRSSSETADRTWTQIGIEGLFRFLSNDQAYIGGRYNRVSGPLSGMTTDVSVRRFQIGGGVFVTPNVLVKAEYVNQQHNDYPTSSIFNGGEFKGVMFEGVIAF